MPVQPEYEHLDMGNQNNIANTEYAKLTPTDSVTNRTAAESEEVSFQSRAIICAPISSEYSAE